MEFSFEVITVDEYINHYKKFKEIINSPFVTPYWINIHKKSFNDTPLIVLGSISGKPKIYWILYEVKIKEGSLFYSFGTHGISGIIFYEMKDSDNIKELFRFMLNEFMRDDEKLSLSLGYTQYGYYSEKEKDILKSLSQEFNGSFFERVNHIATVNNIINNEREMSFKNYIKRSTVSRSIKKAKSFNIKVSETINLELLKDWQKIHEQRITELNGKPWFEDFFITSFNDKDSKKIFKFFILLNEKDEVCGGVSCFYVKEKVLELQMMSTLREYQSLGANYLLTEEVYKWAIKNNIKYINWQASNPPVGGIVDFKERWMAERYKMYSINIIKKDKISNDRLKEVIIQKPYRFFYPIS